MGKILFGVLIGFIVAGILGAGTLLIAQERGAAMDRVKGPLIVLGGLKLEPGADVESAENLFKEKLIPGMTEIDGLQMRILKRMKMPGFQADKTDTGAYDYIMMAEIEKLQVLMKLMREGDSTFGDFGDTMKELAGKPYINAYTIIAKTEKAEETE